jgi:hypothetical protein
MFKSIILSLYILINSVVNANTVPVVPQYCKDCEYLVRLVFDDKEVVNHVIKKVCVKPSPKTLQEKKVFCSKLVFASDFFEVKANYDKLPGRMCGQVLVQKSDLSLVVDFPNLVSFPGCPCV